jgi:hypothetical protein
MKRFLSLLLLFGLIFACGDDDDSSSPEPTEQPPEVIAPRTDFQGPQTNDPAAAPVQTFVTLGSATGSAMSGFMSGLTGYTAGEPTESGGTWTWTETYGEYTYTVTVVYSASSGWTWTFTIDGGEYDNWVTARGWMNVDGTAGWWKFYAEGTAIVEFSMEWQGDDDNGSSSWYEGDFEAGGTLAFDMIWSSDAESHTVTFTVPEEWKLEITEYTDGSGELYYWEWNTDLLDWELMFEANWTATGSGSYTDYNEDPPVTITWG